MFCFNRVVPTGLSFLQETLRIFWRGIKIQGEMESDDILLEACSTCLLPKKERNEGHTMAAHLHIAFDHLKL